MELCECCARDVFEFEDDPLLEEEIALIAEGSLKVNKTKKFYFFHKILKQIINRDLHICMNVILFIVILKQQIY